MRTVHIRTFTMLGLLFILLVPWIFFLTAHFLQTNTLSLGGNQLQKQRIQKRVSEIIHLIGTHADNWTDPIWQNELQTLLREAKLDAVILNASDQEIYRSQPGRERAWQSSEQFSMIGDGQVLGRVVIYLPSSKAVSMIAVVSGLLLAVMIVAVAMRRLILKPLDRMSRAARQLASGDWEIQQLPSFRITEIAEVRNGFEVMVEGLQQSFQKQLEMEEERRFVIAAVAHDLRTPLFALRGYLDGIEQGIADSPDKLAKYLAACKEKSAQLDRLVEDLFTFTKVEYLEAELNRSTLDLGFILQKAVDNLRPLAQQKDISVIMNCSADDLRVIGDAHLLERALNNIMDNAVRHTPSDGKILVQCEKDEHKVIFTIHDTGPGFASDELGHVFEPLYRGEASRNRSTGGAGLGLSISQRIIKQHGGELAAGNHPDQGALLSGWIPSATA
ncbi:sensor histidine kinase [Paenibacillus ihumii]|uniref:sensor histidine kinase n=1 Tax=Paenibacillus ihumii TaxID=687436 RepID=UPI0006D7B52A|nr:HAMP domain-containing sensor histidine kinase [Paenibacillus ihumii]